MTGMHQCCVQKMPSKHHLQKHKLCHAVGLMYEVLYRACWRLELDQNPKSVGAHVPGWWTMSNKSNDACEAV